MAVIVGPREKAILTQTLAPLLLGLVRHPHPVTIELKNELQVAGRIELVDCFMNVTMTDAVLSSPAGPISKFGFMFLQRKSIRGVQIPDEIPLQKRLQEQVDIVTGKRARDERIRAKKKRANFLRKKEAKRMAAAD